MRVLGLTGGIGSGKSTVARMFTDLGAEVIDADQLAREVVEPGEPALEQIRAAFGNDVLRDDGRLDRARLAEIVFSDPVARERLNAITHPRILARMQAEVRSRHGRSGLLLLDIPLLFENGRQAMVEKVILVWVDAATQLRRLCERDHLGEPEARRRIAAQMPLDQKRSMADEVIDNSGTLAETRVQVEAMARRYRAG
ncbi:MAG: dephospho-CoA kinase [Candidatus Dormibacteraeota bacterium]|nr:dephospho-CoA kinase [Candidatus Dormibacteraeota bacterium]